MKDALRELRQLADAMPPGPMRDQVQADVTCLRVRLLALPARVAAHAPFATAAEAKAVMDREFNDAFRDVMKWIPGDG
jgi:hypothetical protein